ncbi:hypothetical protein ACFL6N_05010 [Thermodesulfobacteriota bacterium]
MSEKKSRFRRLFIWSMILLGLGGVLLFRSYSLPDSAQMQEYFHQHRESLAAANREILASMAPDGHLQAGVTDKQAKLLDIEFIETNSRFPLEIRYHTHVRGIGVGAYGTGIAFLELPPLRLYSNLENMAEDAAQEEGFTGYCAITENWYSFLWEAD